MTRSFLALLFGILLVAVPSMGVDPPGQTAQLNGFEMYYETHGQGEPLILLHGFGGSGRNWKSMIAGYSDHYRLIVPDLRGHGRSTNPSNEFTHRQSARDVFALLDHLGVETFSAMGISTGGMTLLHMATQQPERVKSMVLIGATTYFPEQAREIMRKSAPENLKPEDYERKRRIHLHGDEQIRSLQAQFHNFKDSHDDMAFTPPLLATISAETLVVHGDRDAFFPVAIPDEMYRSIPNPYLWIVPNGGHVPLDEHAEEFQRLTLDFLAGKWKKR